MTPEQSEQERRKQLLIELVDGQPGQEQLAELQHWMNSDPDRIDEVVDHLLLDSLLQEALGADAVASLVDIVTESGEMAHSKWLGRPAPAAAAGSPSHVRHAAS